MSHITRSADHYYTFDGVTYPGVTGLLKVLDKSDALISWASRNTAEAALTLFNNGSLPTLIETVGAEGTMKALMARSSWTRDEAAALGTEVHNLADLVVRAQPTPSMNETVRNRVLKYAEWWKASGWQLRTSEAMLVNPAVGYGGTLDLLAKDRDGRTVLADIKTGKGVYWEAVLQLTAYARAELIEAAGTLYVMPPVDRYVILHVTAEEVREVEVAVGDLEWEAFRACIRLSQWRDTTKGKRL